MWRATAVVAALLVSSGWRVVGQGAVAPLDEAIKALGTELRTVRYSGTGSSYAFGQSPRPGAPWPGATIKAYTALIDYGTSSMRLEVVRAQMTSPPEGVTSQAVTGEPRQVQLVSGGHAWNVAGDVIAPAPAAVADRVLQIMQTPHGFLEAARSHAALVTEDSTGSRPLTRVAFTASGQQKMIGLLNDQHLLEAVQAWVAHPVLGDVLVETTFEDYQEVDGIRFPRRIVQRRGGFPTQELTVSAVTPNPVVDIRVPAAVVQAPIADVRVDPQKLADGVWYLTGGSHHSVAVEFADHLVVIEAPQSEARSAAVIAELKRTAPNKPVRVLVNTHHHFDHAGGIRAYAADGATILTHDINRSWYDKAFAAPRTLSPDRLALTKARAKFEVVTEKAVLSDTTRTLEVHHLQGSPHDAGMLVAYLPKEKILIEVDVFSPSTANTAISSATAPASPSPDAVNLYREHPASEVGRRDHRRAARARRPDGRARDGRRQEPRSAVTASRA